MQLLETSKAPASLAQRSRPPLNSTRCPNILLLRSGSHLFPLEGMMGLWSTDPEPTLRAGAASLQILAEEEKRRKACRGRKTLWITL